jgi:DNA polymerase-3 subunit delta
MEKIDELPVKLSSGGLFSNKKLAIVKNILAGKKELSSEIFEKFLKEEAKKEKSDLILVFWEAGKPKKGEKLFKQLQKIAKCQEFEFLEGAKLKNWAIEEVGAIGGRNISISSKAAEKLVIFIGNDLTLLSKEIEKIANYRDKGEITEGDIDLLVKSKIDTDIFRTIDALSQGNKNVALRLIHEHLEAGEDPFYLLSMYFFQFRNLLKVKPLAERNYSQYEIAEKLKMHPFVAKKSVEQGRNFSLGGLKKLYKKLCDIDSNSKAGKIDIGLALDRFVAEI